MMMSSLSQTPWISPLQTSIKPAFPLPSKPKLSTFRTPQFSASSLNRPNDEPNSIESLGDSKSDRVKLALARAKEYKKSLKVNQIQPNSEYPDAKLGGNEGPKEVLEGAKVSMEKAQENRKIKESAGSENFPADVGGGEVAVPEALKIAMEKAKEYRKNKGTITDSITPSKSSKLTGSEGGRSSRLENEDNESKIGKKEGLKVSSLDFIGLGFADRKQNRGLPAGLIPISDPFPEGDFPEVEVIVGDASKFGGKSSSQTKISSEEESSDLYKPKVSTWGVFPRPLNISKTFGGGKVIRPGEALESPEERAAKEARTKQLIAAYKKKIGLNIDPKLRADCQEALKEGDSRMDVGRLKEALPYYQQVMDKLPFQTELHGQAALQWSVCQDSLTRSEEARVMYEKLQSHPNPRVRKTAKEFVFSFQAMEILRLKGPTMSPTNSGYQNYFEAFVEDKEKSSVSELEEEGSFNEALPYIIFFLASPVLFVLLIGARKGLL